MLPVFKNHKILSVLGILFCLYLVFRWVQFAVSPMPQDFHIYYFSGKAYSQDLNPYNPYNTVRQEAGNLTRFPFVYPPYTLPLLKQLTHWEWPTSARIFLILKTILFTLTVLIWRRLLPQMSPHTTVQLLALISIGFYECVFRDFRHGNISSFEQFFMWMAALSIFAKRYFLYATFVFIACYCKLALIPFMGLLLFIPQRKGWLPFIAGLGAFLALHGFSFYFQNDYYQQFWSYATGLSETGPGNPSLMMFSRAVFAKWSLPLANGIYVLTAAAISLFFLFRFWPKKDQEESSEKNLDLFVGYCLLYAIVMPRFKEYSYILLIFPTLWVFYRHCKLSLKTQWIFVIAAVVHFFAYQSLILAAVLFFWWLQSQTLSHMSHRKAQRPLDKAAAV